VAGISPEGVGTGRDAAELRGHDGVSRFTPPPPAHIQVLVDPIRIPRGAGEAHEIQA
jgi:cation/acetate symporter